jgi:uncharacterized protein HemY
MHSHEGQAFMRGNKTERDDYLDELVPLREAAQLRKVSLQTLRSLIRQERLRATRLSARKLGMTRREALRSLTK